jgi:uncharacterized protein YneF (UPF0154 family)
MDNKCLILALVLGILIGYFISRLNSSNIIKDVAITHPASWIN